MQELTFAQYVMERYDKSIYQVKLEIAMQEYCSHKLLPHEAWRRAEKFIEDMQTQFNQGDL